MYAAAWVPNYGIFILVDGLIGDALMAHCWITVRHQQITDELVDEYSMYEPGSSCSDIPA